MLTVVAAVFVFGVLVLVHELGHFVTAKLMDMRVDEFAIGFGPKIWSTKKGETEYSIRAIPLGGFNDIAGMDPEDNPAGKRGYAAKPIPARMLVILAGSLMNLLLPIVIFSGVFYFHGVSKPDSAPIFGQVLAGKAADAAGLQPGDRVLAVNGKPIVTWEEFLTAVQANGETTLNLEYERDGRKNTVAVKPEYNQERQRALIGVIAKLETEHYGLIESISMGIEHTGKTLSLMLAELSRIFSNFSGDQLAGPLGVAHMAGEAADMGMATLLMFAAFLSMNLGIINLLPVPALDGGHFLNLVVEAIIRKPLNGKLVQYTQQAGIALLILLFLFATKNDIERIFLGS